MPLVKHPGFAVMIRFEPPHLFTGEVRSEVTGKPCGLWARPLDDDLRRDGVDGARSLITVNPFVFARLLAKIAHGFAVLQVGLDGFSPLLPSVILDEKINPCGLVGGELKPSPSIEEDVHQIRIRVETHPMGTFVVIRLRLFAHLDFHDGGSPTYHIIAGYPNALTQARLATTPFYQRLN